MAKRELSENDLSNEDVKRLVLGIPVKVNIDSGEGERHSGVKVNSSRSEATLA